jgi:eukaryotic-like serine/threonine-protein kinase
MAAETPSATSEQIGGFRFVRMIHPGATSVVMEVIQESTQRRFALKQLLASHVSAAERRAFAFEAKLGMQLRHPNLIRVHEYIRDPEQPYFIMDLFPAIHMKLPIARPSVYPMPVVHLHRIMEQSAAALHYMHEKKWVHRDVKPENILVNKSGDIKVIDYALAMRPFSLLKLMLHAKAPRQGTPSYMAPEQIRCESPTPSADIYSFGITCYEMACGRPPFRANSQTELLQKHLSERPSPPSMHNPAITQEFSDLVLKMIQKKPSDRLASLEDFRLAFTRVRIYKDDPDPMASRGYH